MNRFQKMYMLVFFVSSFGIIGNMELGVSTPLISKVIFGISAFFTIGKFIYLEVNK